jgi:hypothetical protein
MEYRRKLTLSCGAIQVVAGNDTASHVTMAEGIVLETYPATSIKLNVTKDVMAWILWIDNKIHPYIAIGKAMADMAGNCDKVMNNTLLLQHIKVCHVF